MKNFTVATEAVALESVRAPPPLEASLNNGLKKACELKLLQWAIPWPRSISTKGRFCRKTCCPNLQIFFRPIFYFFIFPNFISKYWNAKPSKYFAFC